QRRPSRAPAAKPSPATAPQFSQTVRNVGLVIDPAAPHASGLLGGIARYNGQDRGWFVSICPRTALSDGHWDGIIACDADARTLAVASAGRMPLISINLGAGAPPSTHGVSFDVTGAATLALQHICERAIRNFACVGRSLETNRLPDGRFDAFRELVHRNGH